jgi:hypothetical protein
MVVKLGLQLQWKNINYIQIFETRNTENFGHKDKLSGQFKIYHNKEIRALYTRGIQKVTSVHFKQLM